ncbi:Transcription-associated protein 1 [Choanephora cucurbitarum]|uniref:Transcription-associated protein 1 n=1 Tax=Choanephora cucurbitarum TaxID=101091 RepID=A0A1C7NH90_9FUNG|nr:Transcription-associated protein 1 [Choanephora cucurbitarum]
MTTLQVYAHRLGDSNLATNLKVTIANELRDQVEVFQTAEYPRFLSTLIPVFLDVLQNEQPVFVSNAPEQKLRNIILEIIYRLPQTEALKEYVPELCKALMKTLRIENEDNAVVCVKIIIDLHRSFRQVLEDQVQPFLDIVQEIFQNMEQTVKDAFDNPDQITTPLSAASPRPMSPAADAPEVPTKILAKSMFSFKVLTECPIIVVLLFQSYRRSAADNIMKFIPLIFQTLSLQAKPQVEAANAAAAKGEVFVGVSPAIKQRGLYSEFIVAQVKTMSFLAYILRSYTTLLRPYQNQIPDFVLRLLRECPAESSATRKELLVATRHILSTDFRTSFVPKIDLLLNEKVLIGTGVTAHDTLRPLAYSMLADLIHHIRAELSASQLSRTIYIYSCNLHDATLAPSIQTMCGKLLLNLIDCIMKITDKSEGRSLLMRILDAFASKFEALNIQFSCYVRQYKKKKQNADERQLNTEEEEADINDFDFERVRSIHTASFIPEAAHDGIKDGRFLFKNLAIGLKPLFIGLRHCNPPPPAEQEFNTQLYAQFARGFSQDDVQLFARLFREGLKCFEYYNVDNYGSDGSLPDYSPPEEERTKDNWTIGSTETCLKLNPQQSGDKEVLDTFPIVFTLLDPAVFQELFASQIEFFYERMLINTSLLHLSQYFLVNEITTQGFAGILLRFLVDRIDQLGEENFHYSAVMLHLFRLTFMAVNLFPDANESILQPYLANLVMSCFKLAAKAKEPANYFLLLRALFKSIGGGRFELLYKEVSPLLQVILENLNSLLSLAHKTDMRNLFVELCLAVPVRLSTLLPYLPYLMRPLVIALQADQDLVSQGLRTMELCNDNLNPEFLDHIMAPVMSELMDALWKHLKPLPYNQQHSHAAMRILGKLGGRNRRMLKSPPKLGFNARIENGVSVEVFFDPSPAPHTLPLDKCLDIAIHALTTSQTDVVYKKHAYNFLKAHLIFMLELDEGPDDLAETLYKRVKGQFIDKSDKTATKVNTTTPSPATSLLTQNMSRVTVDEDNSVVGNTLNETGMKPKRLSGNGYTKYASKRMAQEEALRGILVSMMTASIIEGLDEDVWSFFLHICRHFTLLHIGEAIEAKENGRKPLANMMDERLTVQHLNTTILVEAIVEVMSSSQIQLRKRGEEALHACYNVASTILGSSEYVDQLPIFRVFASQFCSCCYKPEWFKKRGGCLGISIMSSQLNMGTRWMREHELDFIRSLLFVLKDASPEMANVNTEEATQTLSHVLKVCNGPEDGESPEAQQKFQNLITLLLSELSNSNSVVRETIQSSFQLLADLTGNEVTELLAPVRERLVAPIFAKPLRALPFAMQIGHIDAITYCLTLRPPFLEFNDELTRLLHEALALADAEDQALVSRSSQYKNTASLMSLRIVCIKLLSAALACSDFSSQRQTHTRARIIQVFFKSLYSKSIEVVEAAHRGLKQVLAQQHKLPKELLQQGLRPILTTLSNHKTLSVAGLEGLARLLELLTNYFKVEIGKKLLDHLKQWAEPKVLQEAANKPLSENHEIKIIVAILNIFHLLPAAAHIFLDELVIVVLEMEGHLRRSVSSPFRPNLIKYLNRYPVETVAYFYERLNNDPCSQLFADILDIESASRLREEVANTSSELVSKAFKSADTNSTNSPSSNMLHYRGVTIVHTLVNYDPDYLTLHPEVFNCLLELWRKRQQNFLPHHQKEEKYSLMATRELLLMAKIFIGYLQKNSDEVDLIFDLVALFAHETVADLSFLQRFFLENVALKSTSKQRRAILDKFLTMFTDNSMPSNLKMVALRQVVNPSLLATFVRKDVDLGEILDASMMERLDEKIWANLMMESSEDNQYIEDSLRIELLQMTAMIVQYAPHLLADRRKEVIKFGWNYLRLEDATSKQAAYVLISHFIAAYDTPSKIAIQIYAALLRAHSSEARVLVKQGLDIIAPVLPIRIAPQANERVPTWVRLTRKVVVEDTHSISQMVNVYQLLIRHSDLFFEYREHFLPQIVNTLPKLGLLQNATPEHKLLTVELTELIIKWERKRIELQKSHEVKNDEEPSSPGSPTKRKMDVDGEDSTMMEVDNVENPNKKAQVQTSTGEVKAIPSSASTTNTKSLGYKEYSPSLTLRENVVGYLVRLACMVFNPSDLIQKRLVQRTIGLIKSFLKPGLWSDVSIRFNHLERSLIFKEANEMVVSSVCSALEILNADIAHRETDWFILNISQLYRLLEPSIRSENSRIQTALYPVLVCVIEAINNHKNSLTVGPQNPLTPTTVLTSASTPAVTSPATAFSPTTVNTPLGSSPAEPMDEDPSSVTPLDETSKKGDASSVADSEQDVGSQQLQQPAEVSAFMNLIDTTIQEGLSSMSNIFGVLKLLQAASLSDSAYLDPYVPGIVKILQLLTKEHTLPSHSTSSIPYDSQVSLLISGLSLLKKRIVYLGDQRRWFLTCLIQLIEKSPDATLLRNILDILSEWVLEKTDPIPTIKEKAGLLGKMMTIETRQNAKLTEDFLMLVLKIYSNPNFARSELTVRMEQAFLLGTRNENPKIRAQFMSIFDKSVGQLLPLRLNYILGIQNWEPLANHFWIHQALDLLIGSVKIDTQVTAPYTLKVKPISIFSKRENDDDTMEVDVPKDVFDVIKEHRSFLKAIQKVDVKETLDDIRQLQYLDSDVAFKLWVDLFPMCWSALSSVERHDVTKALTVLLSKDYHNRQSEQRPNVMQAILTGISNTKPTIPIPSHLIKYLGKTHNCWHTAIEMLQTQAVTGRLTDISREEQMNHQRTLDALSELYSALNEDDMFYGLWRRRSIYSETNMTVSCEQCGMWQQAQHMYENVQIKARGGVLPQAESESMLWEEHWIMCTQKLQQWDVLSDLAKHDNNTSLLLECAWRLSDWTAERELLEQSLHQSMDLSLPRQKIFEGFLSLIKSQTSQDKLPEFTQICEEGVQLALRKWYSLPPVVAQSHLPLLQTFQQYLELSEASQIFKSLSSTNAQNLDMKSAELRSILGTWRERLPNMWDDINIWSDLVAWRQHIFSAINRTYLPLIPLLQPTPGQNNASSGHSYAYRGYHETAWIINRFAHVARKHQLYDVCINYLTKIYTLPNIEIQEAFLKLREQAKCYYQNTNELTAGLDVINNTNLMYFTHQQKAEFFTLKGMFLAKLNHNNEANEAYVNAVQIDMTLPRAWAEWGRYNDRRFKENPKDLSWANSAVSCYLQASGLYKNAKARKHLLRILWLLSLDDQNGTISRAVENYKGEWPVWYWITFIPQLLTALQHREGRHARAILIRIAKQFPQALHFQLRTAKEDMLKRASVLQANMTAENAQQNNTTSSETNPAASNSRASDETKSEGAASENKDDESEEKEESAADTSESESVKKDMDVDTEAVSVKTEEVTNQQPNSTPVVSGQSSSSSDSKPKDPQQAGQQQPSFPTNPAVASVPSNTSTSHQRGMLPSQINTAATAASPLDEVMSMLKTGYPLLALSMETMVDQIQLKFKPQADEDMYRLVVALYNEGAQQLLTRLSNPNDTFQLTHATVANIHRFADSLYPGHMKTAFVNDFARAKLNLEEYVAKLRLWRDKFEAMLDARPRKHKLEASSHYLVEFQHQKFDDVEIPGQYLMLKDNANDFLRIDRFLPEVEIIRSYGNCCRRLTIRGNDGTLHPFLVQNPVARQFRREERLMQLFRMLNYILERRKESRMRNLQFHLPAIVPLAPNVRMIQDDPSYTSLYDIYEDHCDSVQMHKDDPLVYFVEKFKNNVNTQKDIMNQKTELLNLRMEINDYISTNMVPSNILSKYLFKIMNSYTDYWMLRKRFTGQYATATLMAYIFSVGHRMPHKIMISRSTGNVWMTELLPGWNAANPLFGNGEAIPFRFTPNIQEFITPIGVEGLFTSCLMATARCLTEPEFELDQYLCLFVRDELATWHLANHRSVTDIQFRERINTNVLQVQTKTQFLSCKADREKTLNAGKPLNQNVIDLISQASNPQKMAQMECTWMPWL